MRPACLTVVTLLFCNNVTAIKLGYVPFFGNDNENVEFFDAIEVLIKSSDSLNPICKNHTLLYLKDLKSFRIWASDMFDASTKFSSGRLYGETYDFGNYDECIEVVVPNEYGEFTGRPCLAKFTVEPPKKYKKKKHLSDYRKFYNQSMLDQIFSHLGDPSRVPRNEFYYTYCIPSSCTNEDLQNILDDFLDLNTVNQFKIKAEVNKITCQLSIKHDFIGGDFAFLAFVVGLLGLILIASFYDFINKLRSKDDSTYTYRYQKLLLCFSFPRNLRKLVTIKNDDKDGLSCIGGLKAITMALIILGHGLMFIISSPMQNPIFVENMYSRMTTVVLLNGPVVVDTFFLISGFLTSYLMLLKLHKRNRGINIFLLYIHRILRLTPSYAFIIAFYCTVFSKLGSGLFWHKKIVVEQERCQASWWANLLYINNYIKKDEICMFQSWYLSCEIHLFMVSVLLVLFLWKKPRKAIITISTTLIVSITAVFLTVYIYDEEAILLLYVHFLKDPVLNSTYKSVYIPSHLRLTPYLIGILVGYLRYKIKKHNYKMSRLVCTTGWFICMVVMLTTMYSGYVFYNQEIPKSIIFNAVYSSMYHLTWGASISWIIIAVSCGYGAYINSILSWTPCIILSRLTYSTFLVHGIVQMFFVASLRSPQHMGYLLTFFNIGGQIFFSFLFGWILTMLVEAPILGMEKIIFSKAQAKYTESTENLEEKVENGRANEKGSVNGINGNLHISTHI